MPALVDSNEQKKRIAIVGSGVSGLSALWTLRNAGHEIDLFEAEDRLGGHTNTVPWTHGENTTPVDTGFIVMNTATYPNFINFLNTLKVNTIQSEMTFGISRDKGAFEWSGTSGAALFAQKSNILKPSFWRMIFDIIRFNQFALNLLASPPSSKAEHEMSIGEYLDREGYSDVFRDDYLIPMTACVWSTGADKCALEFPALTLVRFMWNHHLLSTVAERPPWMTIEGGSKNYIDAVIKICTDANVFVSTPVVGISRKDGRVDLRMKGTDGIWAKTYDEVVLACHGDQARTLLGNAATMEEKDILGSFETTPNLAYLHSDLELMPKRRAAWSAWNYLTTSQPPPDSTSSSSGDLQTVSLTYNMNILQHLPAEKYGDVLVTLNPAEPPNPALTKATFEYRHPLYNAKMVAAQEELEKIQGKRGIWYAGAWTGYGFHEDGFASGMRIGLRLGGSVPWEVKDAKFSRGVKPVFGWKDYLVRLVIMAMQFYIGLIDRVLGLQRRSRNGLTNGSGSIRSDRVLDGKKKAM